MTDLPERPTDLATNPELLNALLARWRPYLTTAARNRMRDGDLRLWSKVYDDDDVAQEVLMRAARQVRRYDPTRGTFKQFLNLCFRDACGQLFRNLFRQSGRPAVAFQGEGLDDTPDRRTADPVTTAEENDLWEHIGRDLDAGERVMLRLRHREGLMRRQIADRLGIGEGACHHRYLKLKEKLAAAL